MWGRFPYACRFILVWLGWSDLPVLLRIIPTSAANALTICSGRLARGASVRLPVDGDDLVFTQCRDDAAHPDAKGLFELFPIKQREEDVLEGVGRDYFIVETKKARSHGSLASPDCEISSQ